MKNLKQARERAIEGINNLTEELTELYEDYPSLFPKRPNDMSVSDKLRFSDDLIRFIEVRDQYKEST